jgi:hypothetical protein
MVARQANEILPAFLQRCAVLKVHTQANVHISEVGMKPEPEGRV